MSTITNLNETISSPTPNNEELTQPATKLYDKWHRLGSFSRVVRYAAWIIVAVATVAAAIYFSVYSPDVAEWYAVLLATLCVTAISVLGCGLLVLLLKPFFWFNRKKAKKVHERLIEEEEAVLSADILSVQQPLADYMCAHLPLQEDDDANFSAETVFDNYRDVTCDIYNNTIYLRELQMDKARWGEWCWVISACLVVIMAIAVAVAIAALLVLIFVSLLLMAIDYYSGASDYIHRDYDPDVSSKEPSLLRTFLSAFYGRFLRIAKAISNVKATVKNGIAQKIATKFLLQAKGVALPESVIVPYWPTLNKHRRRHNS